MTSYRLFDGLLGRPGVGSSGTQPPATPITYTGNFIAGTIFTVTQGGCFFEGYWYWVATGAPTAAQKFALWTYEGADPGTTHQVVSGSVVTSGPLNPGMNFVAVATPIPLSVGTPYVVATGVNGKFNDTASQFNLGDPYAAGVTNGPLRMYSGNTGSFPPPGTGMGNGTFSVAGTDPSLVIPLTLDSGGDTASNFWIDPQVRDTDPTGYAGSYRMQPNSVYTDADSGLDDAVPYGVATEFVLSTACVVNKIWFLSPAAQTGGLPTRADIWSISGPNAGTRVVDSLNPTWSGAAGSGWVSTSFSGQVLQPGHYKVNCYNKNGATGAWNYKRIGAWAAQSGHRQLFTSDVVWGPITFPIAANASLAYNFNGSGGAGNPPNSDGTTLHAQGTFSIGDGTDTDTYPYLYVGDGSANGQFYGVDVEVTPTPSASGSLGLKHLALAGLAAQSMRVTGSFTMRAIGMGGSGNVINPEEVTGDFGDAQVCDLFDRIQSFALESGRFDAVNTYEPKSQPGNGVSMSLWIQDIRPVRTSGLNSTSALILMSGRIYTSMTQQPYDLIDQNVLSAAVQMIGALSGEFELGGENNVRMVDLLGSNGVPLAGKAGYVEVDRHMYRVMTLDIPIVINDIWSQER